MGLSSAAKILQEVNFTVFLGNLCVFFMTLLKGRAFFLLSNVNLLCIYLLVKKKSVLTFSQSNISSANSNEVL